MHQVNIITGANGTGKSNLYQALMLVARAAHGQFARAIAEEGGTPSILWAGGERIRYTRKRPAKRFDMTVETDTFGFSFSIGLPSPSSLPIGPALFNYDPEVKEEKLWLREASKSVLMLDRRGPTTWLRNTEGKMDEYAFALLKYESVFAPNRGAAPLPGGQPAAPDFKPPGASIINSARTPCRRCAIRKSACIPNVLSHDGSDLAAALETIIEIGDAAALNESIARAFGGAALRISSNETLFSVHLQVPGLLRPLDAREFFRRTASISVSVRRLC